MAFEVVMERLDKEFSNLEKDLAEGWDRIVFCVDSQETATKLARTIPQSKGTWRSGC